MKEAVTDALPLARAEWLIKPSPSYGRSRSCLTSLSSCSTASSASDPIASRVATAPQLRFVRITSITLSAENLPFAVTSQISERKAFARRTNSAAGRACNPISFTIVIWRDACPTLPVESCLRIASRIGSCPSGDAEIAPPVRRSSYPPADRSPRSRT